MIDAQATVVSTPSREPTTLENSPALLALETLTNALNRGEDLGERAKEIERLVMGQAERAEVVDSLLSTHDYTRLVAFMKAQAKVEGELLAALMNGGLTPADQIAMLEYIRTETKHLENKVRGQTTTIRDVAQLLSKLDQAAAGRGDLVAKQLAGTTSQGREIIRRLATKLHAAAKGSTKGKRSSVPD